MIFGGLMGNAGSFAEAVSALERAVSIAPDEANAWYWLAACRLRRGDKNGARNAFERGFSIEPGNAVVGLLGPAVRQP